MIIGIDATRAARAERTGVEETVYQLILHLARCDKENSYLLYTDKLLPPELIDARNFTQILAFFPRLWHKFRFPLLLLKRKPDVLFIPGYTPPPLAPEKTVVMIHDLASKYFPEAYSNSERQIQDYALSHSAKTAKHIICLSQSTRSDFHRFYNFPKSRTSVVYPGYDETRFAVGKSKPADSDYILFVGRLEERKNVLNIIRAYKEYRRQSQRCLKLVLAGKPGYGFDRIKTEIGSLGSLRKDVVLANYVGREKLSKLYANAKLFLFPSLYEGFGLPVLEAFASGTPVITAKTSSLPEAAGDAAILVDPLNIGEIAGAIKKITDNKSTGPELIRRGLRQCRKFSWDKAAKETLAVLKSA